MKAIFKREFESYFKSPLGYIFLALFLAFSALVFFTTNVSYGTTIMTNYFMSICYIFVVVVPLLTMKMFSEERKLKTDQLLLTSPVKVTEIVMGKFLSGVAMLGIAVGITLLYLVFMRMYGNPAVAQSLVGYFGIMLYGAMLTAMGMFISSLTQSQVVSAIATLALVGLLTFISGIYVDFTTLFTGAFSFLGTFLNGTLVFLDINARFTDFAAGTLNIVPLVYFVSITALFILLTVRV
ncbi:MAG: ABC transporter permease subunit, partial [Clostridia bacterium]|nr:ABC transporter permease subunit [Clostridia bacterium]